MLMAKVRRALVPAWILLLALGAGDVMAGPKKAAIPLPRMSVGRAAEPPVIDGTLAPGEWDRATAATAFVSAFSNQLAHVQTVVWVMYDDEYFYVCFKNYRTEKNTLLSKRARTNDDIDIVFDHTNEIWFSPPETPAPTYQSMFNSYPAIWDVMKIPTVGHTQQNWTAEWKMATSETREYWIVEGRAPIRNFSTESPVEEGAVWRGLFTNDDLAGTGGGFTAWAPGGGFEVIDRHGWLHFHDNAPAFQFLEMETVFTGQPVYRMAVTGPREGEATVQVTVRWRGGVDAGKEDLVREKTLTVAAGERQDFALEADLTQLKLPTRPGFRKRNKNYPEAPTGFCEVRAETQGGTLLYHQVFPFDVDGIQRRAPEALRDSPYETPFGVRYFHAPLSRKLVLKIDRLYMDDPAAAAGGTAVLTDPRTGKVVSETPVAPFINDYSQTVVDLARVKLPVQDAENWQAHREVEQENKVIRALNKGRAAADQEPLPLREDPLVQPLAFPVAVTLTDEAGGTLATVETEAALVDYEYEWLGHDVGVTDEVIPPWTPLAWDGRTLRMWNKAYVLNGLGLSESIVNDGRPQLSGPMRLEAVVDGERVAVEAAPPRLVRLTDAAADFESVSRLGELDLRVRTRVEFDGFVYNRMTLEPRQPVTLDRLSLVVEMPAAEGECYCTTAGGWTATAGFTPDEWDASLSSSGSRHGSFVPYIFLTDSERGFCWFADNDEHWVIDPDVPEQDLRLVDGTRRLRVHFIGRTATLEAPRTVEYGWIVTPRKPQPKRWRAYQIHFRLPYPKAEGVFYRDCDRVINWHYYAAPFPHDMETSRREILQLTSRSRVVPAAGQAGESLGVWRDYKGRPIKVLAADWGIKPGARGSGITVRHPEKDGANDFQVWHWDKWMREARLQALYFDLNYLSEEWNFLGGSAYLLPDGRVQPGYSYLGLRKLHKRLRTIFHQNGIEAPNIWLHTTLGHPVYAWMPDVTMEGENVHPTGPQYDYQDAAHAGRLRAIVMGRNLGSVPTLMAQATRDRDSEHYPFLARQLIGWLQAHDCLPNHVDFWPVLASELAVWREDIEFIPYWREDPRVRTETAGVVTSAHARPGHVALWINNTERREVDAEVVVDARALKLRDGDLRVFDTETGEVVPYRNGRLHVSIGSRGWRGVRLQAVTELAAGETFRAGFDDGVVRADEALGHLYAEGSEVRRAIAPGRSGLGLALDERWSFGARQHLGPQRGSIHLALRSGEARGLLCRAGPVSLLLEPDALRLQEGSGKTAIDHGAAALAADAWQEVELSWQGTSVQVRLAGEEVLAATLQAPLALPVDRRGVAIADRRRKTHPPEVAFGPAPGAVIDDLVMGR
jgi:hypothetical protein